MEDRKQKIFILLFFLVATCSLIPSVLAQGQGEKNDVVEVQEPTKDPQVEQIRQEITEKIKGEGEVVPENEKKAFFGQIVDIFNQTVVLQAFQGKKTAKVDTETEIVGQSNAKLDFEDLEIDSYIIAMGYAEDAETLLTKRIVVSTKPKPNNRLVLIGKVGEIEKKTLNLTTLKESASWEASFTTKTKVIQKSGDETEEVDINLVEEGDLVLIVGTSEEDGEIAAKTIYLLTPKETENSENG